MKKIIDCLKKEGRGVQWVKQSCVGRMQGKYSFTAARQTVLVSAVNWKGGIYL